MTCSLGFMVMGFFSGLSLASHSQSPSLWCTPCSAKMDAAKRILGGGRTCGVSFWLFLHSSGCGWLISSVFLTRTSCHKIAHANGYHGAWPGWAVSVHVLPLTAWRFVSTWIGSEAWLILCQFTQSWSGGILIKMPLKLGWYAFFDLSSIICEISENVLMTAAWPDCCSFFV